MSTTLTLVLAPWFKETRTFGFHDWDVQASHRYLVLLSLFRYHEFPAWNPFACGGFPAWGYVESDTIVVSPFLPAYLLLPLALALRIEVLGMAVIGAAGAYAAASRFTSSHAARALTAVIWAVNGRWALQIAAGHTWHLAYAWMPWCLFFFERARASELRARASRRILDYGLGGACIAMLVYSGASTRCRTPSSCSASTRCSWRRSSDRRGRSSSSRSSARSASGSPRPSCCR